MYSVLSSSKVGCVQVGQWTSTCLETCIKRLADFNKPFKYVVTTVIMQKNGKSVYVSFGVTAATRQRTLPCKCRGWTAYSSILLLGQQLRWQSDREVGEQNNVLHHNSLWLVIVAYTRLLMPMLMSSRRSTQLSCRTVVPSFFLLQAPKRCQCRCCCLFGCSIARQSLLCCVECMTLI